MPRFHPDCGAFCVLPGVIYLFVYLTKNRTSLPRGRPEKPSLPTPAAETRYSFGPYRRVRTCFVGFPKTCTTPAPPPHRGGAECIQFAPDTYLWDRSGRPVLEWRERNARLAAAAAEQQRREEEVPDPCGFPVMRHTLFRGGWVGW